MEFAVPGPDAPGFLRRQRKALEFATAFGKGDTSPEMLDRLVEFLADYVTKPEGREDAIEALWDATQAQFEMLLNAVTGVQADVPKASAAGSRDGLKEEA